jgi:hypothetical protein
MLRAIQHAAGRGSVGLRHAARQCGDVAARGTRAADGDAGDRKQGEGSAAVSRRTPGFRP